MRHLLSEKECLALMDASEAAGFEHAGLSSKVRGCERVVVEAPDIAQRLWERSEAHVCGEDSPFAELDISEDEAPDFGSGSGGRWKPVGLNSRFRSCRYGPRGHFAPHCDGWLEIPGTEHRTFLTFMVYLNDVPEDRRGATRFFRFPTSSDPPLHVDTPDGLITGSDAYVTCKVQPEAGMAVVFKQAVVLHDGEPLASGSKSIFRSDVVFDAVPSAHE